MLPNEGVPVLFSILEKIIPETTYIFFTEALNKRLGVDGKNIEEIT